MTTPFRKPSLLANFSPSRWLLLFAVLIAVAVASPTHPYESAAKAWQGNYYSNMKQRDVTVRLTLSGDTSRSELQLVTEQCRVGLESVSEGHYVIKTRKGYVAGPYCAIWLGGRLEAQPVDGGQRLEISFADRKGKSVVKLTLSPAHLLPD